MSLIHTKNVRKLSVTSSKMVDPLNKKVAAKLEWIHIRYFPPALILQLKNTLTGKVREKIIELKEFNHFTNLDELSKKLIRKERSFRTSSMQLTLMDCLSKLKEKNQPDFRKQFKLQRQIQCHQLPVLCASFSRDGTRFATGSLDRSCKIWDSITGEEHYSLIGHYDAVSKCIFDSSGDKMLTGSYDGTVKLWHLNEVKKIHLDSNHTFHDAEGPIQCLDWSNDGNLVATGSSDAIGRVYDAIKGRPLYSFRGHSEAVTSVQIDHAKSTLLTGSDDGKIGLWDLRCSKMNQPISFLTGHSSEVLKCSFDFWGTQVISCSTDKTVKIWDLRNLTNPRLTLFDNTNEVWDVEFNTRGRLIASGSIDGQLLIWDSRNGSLISQRVAAHDCPIHQITFNPAGTHLLTCSSEDNKVKLWNAEIGECLQQLEADPDETILYAQFNYLGNRILTVTNENSSYIWE